MFRINLNGTSETKTIPNLTIKSATDRLNQNGTSGPQPRSGLIVFAHDTSFEGSKNEKLESNATEKNNNVSIEPPIIEENKGALHHSLFEKNKENNLISSN